MPSHPFTVQASTEQPAGVVHHDDPRQASAEKPSRVGGQGNPDAAGRRSSRARWPLRLVVAASLLTGLAAVAVVTVAVSASGTEPLITGLLLLGFAAGWAMLFVLSLRFTDRPQRWAAVPAVALGATGGALLLVPSGSAVLDALGWVWPPALLVLCAWVAVRIRRELPRRGGRWLLYPVLTVMALAAVGGGYATVARSLHRASLASLPGQLIDVGDHQLLLSCSGSGEPTAILESGLGESSAAWARIAPSVATATRVCVYDRAGRGRSELAATQDAGQIATDLHTLLDRAGVTGPLVMVGHSLGGVYVLDYTARYPQQVAGLVLVDATPPTAFTSLPDYPGFYNLFRYAAGLSPTLARLGVTGLVYGSIHADLPPEARELARGDWATADQARSQRDEFAMVPDRMDAARSVTTLGGMPLFVVTATVDTQPGWLPAQEDLATLSENSVHLVVAGATHGSLMDTEADAALTNQAIVQVVDSARTGRPLVSS